MGLTIVGLAGVAVAAILSALRMHSRMRAQSIAYKNAQQLLEESHERLELALDGANEALWDWDIKANRTYYSERWSQMLGFSPQEIGDSVDMWGCLVHPEDFAAATQKLEAHLAGASENYQAAFRMKTKQGDWRWIQARGKVVARASDGSPVRVAGTHLDVTEQKELARALADARDAALAASKAKSAFLASMSHEIRTPMNGIIGISELLLEGSVDQQQRAYAEIIRDSSEALLTIVNEVLDFSKIEAGEMSIDYQPVDLHAVLRQAADLFSVAAKRKNVAVNLEITPDVPTNVSADAGRLRQVLVNLLGNALKFTSCGSVSLCCRTVPNSSQHSSIEFEISDTGIGMEPAVLTTLFRPFIQADATTSNRYGGTGLGLAISKQLVELMHGSIQVTSVAGKGTTFRVLLPLQQSTLPRRHLGKVEIDAQISGLCRAHILVAEDDLINQTVIKHMLTRLGHTVDIVSDGQKAVEATRSTEYDVILMDCQMPEMNGYEAARLIRQRYGSVDRPPVIALTANAMATDRQDCIDAGMDDYIAKPVSLRTLTKVLDPWLLRTRETAA